MLTYEDYLPAALILGVIFTITGLVGAMEAKDREMERREYCEMRALYKQSNGQMGWPDYKPLTNCETQQ